MEQSRGISRSTSLPSTFFSFLFTTVVRFCASCIRFQTRVFVIVFFTSRLVALLLSIVSLRVPGESCISKTYRQTNSSDEIFRSVYLSPSDDDDQVDDALVDHPLHQFAFVNPRWISGEELGPLPAYEEEVQRTAPPARQDSASSGEQPLRLVAGHEIAENHLPAGDQRSDLGNSRLQQPTSASTALETNAFPCHRCSRSFVRPCDVK